jgi:hypothetical protein
MYRTATGHWWVQDAPLSYLAEKTKFGPEHFPSHSLCVGTCADGAGDGTRTRDNLLGRQALYQLSYSRNEQKFTTTNLGEAGPFES